MDKEQSIINKFSNKFIGDDGAVVGKLVFSKDLFVEDSHFKRSWLSLFEIGFKAMLVNISDAIAMNATPKYALLGLGIPKNLLNSQINELCDGLKKAAKNFNIKIIGGDTIKSEQIIISLTIISYINNKAVFRHGAKLGDFLCYTGELGNSLKDLRILQNGGKLDKNSRFKRPILRNEFMYKTAKFMRSAMDISDGLASDIPKILGNFNIKFKKKPTGLEMKSGEEYELLFVVCKNKLPRILNEAKKCRINLNILGKIIKGRFKSYGKFKHF